MPSYRPRTNRLVTNVETDVAEDIRRIAAEQKKPVQALVRELVLSGYNSLPSVSTQEV